MQTITIRKDTQVYEKGRGSFLISTGTRLREGSKIEVVKFDYLLYKSVPCKAVAIGRDHWLLCEESGIPFPN